MSSHKRSDAIPIAQVSTSSFLVSNLHCPSCVSTIEDAVFALQPTPLSVSPSVLTLWVTVRHWPSLEVSRIQQVLEEAGFDVCSITKDGVARDTANRLSHNSELPKLGGYFNLGLQSQGSRSREDLEVLRQRHLSVCKMCQDAELYPEDKETRPASSLRTFSLAKTAPWRGDRETEDAPDIPVVVIDEAQGLQDKWRANLFIGGMTCASCSNTITSALKELDFIRNVSINLIANSGTIDYVGKDNAAKIVEEIEDIGYEAKLDALIDLNEVLSPRQRRTVQIEVDGMHCDHCPSRLLDSLAAFGDLIKVEKPLGREDTILQISYAPQAPNFTVRNIIASLSAVDPQLTVSIYHPPTLEERSKRLHARQRHRFLVRLALTVAIAIPTFLIGIVFMSLVPDANPVRRYLSQSLTPGVSRTQWALFIMATPVYFLAADVFHRQAINEIRTLWRPGSKTPILQRFYRFGSMNMLMSVGTSIAYISSIAQVIAAAISRPEMMHDSSFYFDSVVFLTMFLLIGRLIEAYSKSRTGDAVSMLGKLRPTEAYLWSSENQTTQINVDLLELGDIVKVFNGASPPSDGTITEGSTIFDESSLTGESKLVKKSVGDEVFSGTVNKGSPISIRITGAAGSSMLDQIVAAVREGQTRRAPIEKIADTLTSYFVPAVTLLAISTWIIWLALGLSGCLPQDYLDVTSGGWVAWSLQFAIAVFVVACPCGLALAAPTALFVGGGLAAQHGILVKGGGEAFEKASRLDCIVFDKTGTLTLGGEPLVTDHEIFTSIGIADGSPENEVPSEARALPESTLFAAVKALELNSSHPVAKAIVSFCNGRTLDSVQVDGVEEIAGQGIRGRIVPDTDIIVGNESLMSDYGVEIRKDISDLLHTWKTQGKSVALVATHRSPSSWQLTTILSITDPIRPEAPSLISTLQSRGTAIWLLSGDNPTTAHAIGAQLGIPPQNILAGVLPAQKALHIRHLQRSLKARNHKGREHTLARATIAMVGDGINDAPALATADVGIALASGADIAVSSADFVLVAPNLAVLLTILDLSRTVFRRIKFNFAWALVYNLVALPVAAGALFPIVSGGNHVRLDPVWASLAMAASSVSVICSSLALRSGIPGLGFRVGKGRAMGVARFDLDEE